MATLHHPRVVLRIHRKDIPDLLGKAKGVYNGLIANVAIFPSPSPSLPVLLGLITALDAAEQNVRTNVKGAAAARDLKADALISGLDSERGMVQLLVDANPEQAAHLAGLAGMEIKVVGQHVKEPVVATPVAGQPGAVDVKAHAALLKQGRGKARKTQFNWRATTDGGKTYFGQHSTPIAHTTFTGLALNVEHAFEVSITDSAGTTEWRQTAKKTTPH
jgi:hypothetical protein